ncbi:gamma-glutamyltransferase family protein [Thiocapsa rosea]|uniref:Gamma-glutamyltranspeptidase/glutathione hydrolase n=1 Tax=Thiocapsa rosea TaxID=69360 RepID=A0A495V5D6_9GAMM|nr:gamma-glutamyltransferase [Thiocapsa rosea]RKT43803.1 gamma-glutamyltranspeptidase/glutathione hydrolase [Thiocapsa rosea]
MTILGSVAAGHPLTAEAAAEALRAGGNAFDAALAALCAACVAEPVLASLGGGGFLLARPAGASPVLFDFFAQTPRRHRPEQELEFYPILADFGDATQEFHIGQGSIATPGTIAGLVAIHREHCRLALEAIVAPACRLARDGVIVNRVQRDIAEIVAPILHASPASLALYADPNQPDRLAPVGARLCNPQLAETLEWIAREGADPFYHGDLGARLVRDCAEHGGHLSAADLADYRVERRAPLVHPYRGAHLYTNPPPSQGGFLLGVTLGLLDAAEPDRLGRGSPAHLHALALAQELTQRLRRAQPDALAEPLSAPGSALVSEPVPSLAPSIPEAYRRLMEGAATFSRGTTQISVADREGNLASVTLSNGEGAGYVLPGTGIMLNNMLGEEDINPHGFHRWPTNRRISSMMAPSLLALADGGWVVTGSSGSNRIRSAILQVVSNLIDFGLDLEAAVASPRMHYEDGVLNLEPPITDDTIATLGKHWPGLKVWNRESVFFGGAHSVAVAPDGSTHGAGDPRRGGAALQVG